MAAMKASHERIKALMVISLEKTEAMDLEANPEEIESETENEKVPKEEAAMQPVKSTEEAV
jgi:hypothetical protein